MKTRLDKILVDQGHAASRERAQALILAGRVLVDEQRVDKPGTPIQEGAVIRLLGSDLKYVSRGGLKLERALEHWKIGLNGLCGCWSLYRRIHGLHVAEWCCLSSGC
jgi:23S rRNA (cytidine1920-2'-O)/16S rRNA (cytidine1409-2'-O)-methyltransferase